MTRPVVVVLLCLAAISCRKTPPSGQVLARVDESDITRRDIKTELAGTAADAASIDESAALERLIDRALLTAEARRQGLDRLPSYLADLRRNRDLLLVEALRVQVGAGPPPTSEAIEGFIARHPQRFADRRILVIDRVAAAGAVAAIGSLRDAPCNDSVAARLTASGHPIERSTIVVDTADLAVAPAAPLTDQAQRKSVLHVAGDTLVSDSIISWMRVPMSHDQAMREARSALQAYGVRGRLDHLINQLRSAAQIEYPSSAKP